MGERAFSALRPCPETIRVCFPRAIHSTCLTPLRAIDRDANFRRCAIAKCLCLSALAWTTCTVKKLPTGCVSRRANGGLRACAWARGITRLGERVIPTQILQVLSTIRTFDVRALLMGGQACVLYSAAEYSRDLDLATLATAESLAKIAKYC